MSGNPFHDGEGDWLVVANASGQHALWRPYLGAPKGWRIVYSGPDRDGALDYVEQNFTAKNANDLNSLPLTTCNNLAAARGYAGDGRTSETTVTHSSHAGGHS